MNPETRVTTRQQLGLRPGSTLARHVHDLRETPSEDLRSNQIGDYWKAIRNAKWIMLAAILAGALFGGAYSLKEPMIFRARATLEVQNVNEDFMRMREIDPQAGSYAATDVNILTQLKILESGSLRQRVLGRLEREMAPLPPPPAHYLSKIRERMKPSSTDPVEMARDGINMASSTLLVKQIPQTRIIEITCESSHPLVAANFLNAVAAEYADQALDDRVMSIQQTSRWLTSRLDESKVKMEHAEQKLADFVRSTGLNVGPQQESLAQAKIRQLHQDLSAIQAERAAKQSLWESAKNSASDALPGDFDVALQQYRQQLAQLRREAAVLTTTLTPLHPKVVAVETQLRETEGAMRKERESTLARIKADYDASVRREQLLSSAYSTQSSRVVGETDKQATYELLKREVENARQLHNVLLQQVNQSGLAAAMTVDQVRVVDPAVPNRKPYRPNPLKNASMGIAAGLFLALAYVFWNAQDDGTVRSPEHAKQMNLGDVTVIPPKPEVQKRPVRNGSITDFAHLDSGDGLPELGSSLYADSMRIALTSLRFATQSLTRPPMIVVTSPNPNEGKTTISSNLALAMAETGKRVLLVDLDLRKPTVHKLFNVPNDRGVTDLLLSEDPIGPALLDRFVQKTNNSAVSVLVAGKSVKTPTGLLHSPRLQSLLSNLRDNYDAVLIDSPPAMLFPDARIIAALTDGVMLVLRAGVTDRKVATDIKEMLETDGVPLLAAVLNDVNLHDTAYYRGYTNYYSVAANPDTHRS